MDVLEVFICGIICIFLLHLLARQNYKVKNMPRGKESHANESSITKKLERIGWMETYSLNISTISLSSQSQKILMLDNLITQSKIMYTSILWNSSSLGKRKYCGEVFAQNGIHPG